MREAAEGLRMATNAAAQNAIKKRLVNKLEVRKKDFFITSSVSLTKSVMFIKAVFTALNTSRVTGGEEHTLLACLWYRRPIKKTFSGFLSVRFNNNRNKP